MAQAAEEVAQADDLLLQQVRDLQGQRSPSSAKRRRLETSAPLSGAIREARSNLELLAKLSANWTSAPVVNLDVSPEWLELRAVMVGALEPYSGHARGAVLRALDGVGNGGGEAAGKI